MGAYMQKMGIYVMRKHSRHNMMGCNYQIMPYIRAF